MPVRLFLRDFLAPVGSPFLAVELRIGDVLFFSKALAPRKAGPHDGGDTDQKEVERS